jgi:hypothetical protein
MPKPPWLPRESAITSGNRPGYYWWWYPAITIWDRVIYPALMLIGDIAWFAASIPVALAASLLGLRSWRVEATTIGRPRLTREVSVKGRRRSREAIEALATEIAAGR